MTDQPRTPDFGKLEGELFNVLRQVREIIGVLGILREQVSTLLEPPEQQQDYTPPRGAELTVHDGHGRRAQVTVELLEDDDPEQHELNHRHWVELLTRALEPIEREQP